MGTLACRAVYTATACLMEERFIYLLTRQLAQHISAAEAKELQELLAANAGLQQIYQSLFTGPRVVHEDDLLEAEQSYAAHAVRMHLDGAFDEIAARETSPSFFSRFRQAKGHYMAAALLAGAVIIAIQLYFTVSKSQQTSLAKNQVGTKKGSKSHVVLPDGTNVWLNSDSKITYPDNFQGDTREVSLAGEAYFDVVKNASKPFIIHTGAMDVKVLGTAFNVRSYPTETTTEASLIRGLIEVTLYDKEKKKIILKPNEKLTVLNSDETWQRTSLNLPKKSTVEEDETPLLALTKIHFNKKDSSNAETSWVYNKLSFDNEKIDRVFSKIEQWYDIEIVVEDESIQSKHFTATFESKSLQEVMEALALALNFKYQEKNGKIIIR
jgi:ferric-dicitrate binding protein FerR (iron transport regulator)